MDTNTAVVIVAVIALFALIVVGFLVVFRQRAKVNIKGPAGMGLKMNASNDPLSPPRGVKAKGVTSQAGIIDIIDGTGIGADAEDIKAKKDVRISSSPPPPRDDKPPKA